MQRIRNRRLFTPSFVELLEGRCLLSGVATTTAIAAPSATLLGQDFTVTATVTANGAPVTSGTVDLLNNGTPTGLSASVNSNGVATFSFGAGNALYTGSYALTGQYLGTGANAGSTSAAAADLTISLPSFTTTGDGLQMATVTTGSGPGAVTGQTVTALYSGFYTSTGAEFDESAAHPPGTFSWELNASPEQVISGFDEGASGIEVGETRVLVIPSALGYMDGMLRTFVIQSVAADAMPIGNSAQLSVAEEPATALPGNAISTPVDVSVQDSNGNLVATDTSTVTLAIASGPAGATLGGTTSETAAGGVATFSDLTFSLPGTYTLTATDGSLTSTTTGSITIGTASSGPAAQVAFGALDPAPVVGTTLTPPITVNVEDANGNVVGTDSSSVTLAIASGPTGGTLGGTTTVAAQDGVANFSTLTFSVPGSYTLTASDGSLTPQTSAALTVTTAPVSPVTPTLGNVTLPASVVAGGKLSANVPVVLDNSGSAIKGNVTVNIYANTAPTLDGNQVLVSSTSKKLSIKTDKTHTIAFHIKSLPSTLPAGAYYLVAEVVDPSNATNVTATAQTVTVAAPFVQPSVTVTGVGPAVIAPGKSGTVSLSVTNVGNISASGLSITLTPSADGATQVPGITLAVHSASGAIGASKTKKFKLHFKIPSSLAAGSYFPYLTVTLGGVTTTDIGATQFSVT